VLLVKRLLGKTEHGLTSPDNHSESTLAYLLLVSFALGYIGLLVLSISLFDVASPLDGRMLAPVSWIIITLFVLIFHEAFRNTHLLKSVVASLLLVFFGWRFLFEVVPSISIWSIQGQGLSDRKVQYDPALAWIRNLDSQGLKIYSNTPWTIHLTTRKNVQFLPWKKSYTSGLPNLAYEEDLKEAVEMTANGGSIIVMDVEYLDPFAFPPSFEELTSAGLVLRNDLSSDRFRIYFPAPDS